MTSLVVILANNTPHKQHNKQCFRQIVFLATIWEVSQLTTLLLLHGIPFAKTIRSECKQWTWRDCEQTSTTPTAKWFLFHRKADARFHNQPSFKTVDDIQTVWQNVNPKLSFDFVVIAEPDLFAEHTHTKLFSFQKSTLAEKSWTGVDTRSAA